MEVQLLVDGKNIPLNEFVNNILGGTIAGSVTSLRDIDKNWKKIEVRVTK
jgi:hypothetical protein